MDSISLIIFQWATKILFCLLEVWVIICFVIGSIYIPYILFIVPIVKGVKKWLRKRKLSV